MTPYLRISALICMLTIVAASCPAQQQIPTPGGPVQLPKDVFELRTVCSPGENTTTGQCQLTPRQAVAALGKEVKSSIVAPQMGLNPAYPQSLPNGNLAKTQDPKGAMPYVQCAELLIRASDIVKEVAFPITRHDVPPGELQRLNARLAQANDLLDEARNCDAQANQVSPNQNPRLDGQVQESGPGTGYPPQNGDARPSPPPTMPIPIRPGYGPPRIVQIVDAGKLPPGGLLTANPNDPGGTTAIFYAPLNPSGAQQPPGATPPPGNPPANPPTSQQPVSGPRPRLNPVTGKWEMGDTGTGLNTGTQTTSPGQQYPAPRGQRHGSGSVGWNDGSGFQSEPVTVDIWNDSSTWPISIPVTIQNPGPIKVLWGTLNASRTVFTPTEVQYASGQRYPVAGSKAITLRGLAVR